MKTNKAINEQLIALYQDYYGDAINDIVYCGVVDEKAYRKVYPKIVFLLREPHSGSGGFSIPEGLKRNVMKGLNKQPLERGYMYTWRQVGVWAYALIYGFESYHILKNDYIVAQGLQAVGMTNLKKTGGKARCNSKQIATYTKNEKELWLKELKVMKPDIVITSNYHDVVNNSSLEKFILKTIDNKPFYYSILKLDGLNSIILDFWHPNNRKKRENTLKTLYTLKTELIKKRLLR